MFFFTDFLTFIKSFFSKKKRFFIFNKIIDLFNTQIILTIAMIPLYSKFGIPLTFLSFFGNILFSPFLALFIFFSTLIFIFFLIEINPYPAIFFLKKIINFWRFFMEKFNENQTLYLIFPENNFKYFFLCWPIFFILIFIKKRYKISNLKFFFISLLAFFLIIFINYFDKNKIKSILINDYFSKSSVIIHETKSGIHIFDYSTKSKNFKKFKNLLLYKIMGNLCKNYKNLKISSYNLMTYKKNNNEISNLIKKLFLNEKIKINL